MLVHIRQKKSYGYSRSFIHLYVAKEIILQILREINGKVLKGVRGKLFQKLSLTLCTKVDLSRKKTVSKKEFTVLAFDCETVGFEYGRNHLIELGYCFVSANDKLDFKIVEEQCAFIQPYFLELDEFAPARERNGIGRSMQYSLGATVKEVFAILQRIEFLATQSRAIVAHNLQFDRDVLDCFAKENAWAQPVSFWPFWHSEKCLCTMRNTIDYCAIPREKGGLKFPRLSELATVCGVVYEEDSAHRAMYDARICAMCSVKLLSEGVI